MPAPRRGPRFASLLLPGLAVAALALLSFANGMPSVAIHDDTFFVPARHSLTMTSIGQMFREDTWSSTGSGAGTYRPLAILSIAVNGAMFGNDPTGYHATNVALHVLASVLVFLLLAELSAQPWIAMLAAGLFAAHPIHTEAVDSVFNRSEVLATIGVVAALWVLARWHERATVAAWTAAALIYMLALLCRESAASLPALAAAMLWLIHPQDSPQDSPEDPPRERLRRVLPVAVLLLPLAEYFLLRQNSLASAGEGSAPGLGVQAGDDLASRLLYSAATLREYARMMIWPWPLRATYENFAGGAPLLSLAVHALLLGSAAALRRRAPLVTLAVVFFYVSLAPSTRLFTSIGSAMEGMRLQNSLLLAERVAYLPSVALAIAAVVAIGAVARKRGLAIAAACVVPLIAAGVALTLQRNAQWHSATELFAAEVRAAPENGDGWRLYVSALSAAGRLDEAAVACNSQLDQPSRSAQLFNNCGVVYDKLGQDERAMQSYRRAIDLGLASVGHANLGRVFARLGRDEESKAEFLAAIETETNPAQKHYRTGMMLMRFHPERRDDARREYEAALKLQPDFAAAKQALRQVPR